MQHCKRCKAAVPASGRIADHARRVTQYIVLLILAIALVAGTPVHRRGGGGGSGSSGSHRPPRLPLFHRFRVQQSFFCSRIYPTIRDYPPSFTVLANMSSNFSIPAFRLYVYSSQDIVSQYIQANGSWEPLQVRIALNLLEEYRTAKQLRKEDITFLDIGSNVGVFALIMALAGYNVIAFEPMQRNEVMLRSSICANNLMERITYINLGLGSKRQTCRMMSSSVNSGNGVVFCDNRTVPSGFEVRSTIQIAELDSIITPHIANTLHIPVFKMDTEGLEALVMQGGRQFFSKKELRSGFLEFNTETQNHTHALAQELKLQGFKVGVEGMRGPEYDVTNDPAFSGPTVRDAYAWRP